MPKPTKPLTYSAKEAEHSDAPAASSVDTAASNLKSKPKCSTKRGRTSKQQSAQESKKPKLVTLRASQLQYSDDEEETQLEDHEEPEREVDSEDGTACVFVPASLRSPPPVIAEVEETMEEVKCCCFALAPSFQCFILLFFHNLLSKHTCVFFCFYLVYAWIYTLIFTQSTLIPHPILSLISWLICPMCWAFPKMHCAMMSLGIRHKIRQAQLNHVNISWTC